VSFVQSLTNEYVVASIRPSSTRLGPYDRTGDEITLDEIERIAI
jgi:hypothetical protein